MAKQVETVNFNYVTLDFSCSFCCIKFALKPLEKVININTDTNISIRSQQVVVTEMCDGKIPKRQYFFLQNVPPPPLLSQSGKQKNILD